MSFFSYERIVRGVLTWRQIVVLAALLCVLCIALISSLSHSTPLNLHRGIGIFVLVPLAIAALVDSVRHILPDPLLLCAALIALIALSFTPWEQIRSAVLSAVVFLVIGLFMSRISSFGRGDAKLMGVLGLWLGNPLAVCVALLCAFTSAAFFALILIMMRRAKLGSFIALGPWLIGGAILSWCVFAVA